MSSTCPTSAHTQTSKHNRMCREHESNVNDSVVLSGADLPLSLFLSYKMLNRRRLTIDSALMLLLLRRCKQRQVLLFHSYYTHTHTYTHTYAHTQALTLAHAHIHRGTRMHLCTEAHAEGERKSESASDVCICIHALWCGCCGCGGPAAVAATACCSLVGFRSKFSTWLATSQGFFYTFSFCKYTHTETQTCKCVCVCQCIKVLQLT